MTIHRQRPTRSGRVLGFACLHGHGGEPGRRHQEAVHVRSRLSADPIALLKEAGEALYGPRWQREVARLLDVLDVRVRDWQAGRRPIPADIWPRINVALEAKKAAVAAAQKKVAKAC